MGNVLGNTGADINRVSFRIVRKISRNAENADIEFNMAVHSRVVSQLREHPMCTSDLYLYLYTDTCLCECMYASACELVCNLHIDRGAFDECKGGGSGRVDRASLPRQLEGRPFHPVHGAGKIRLFFAFRKENE